MKWLKSKWYAAASVVGAIVILALGLFFGAKWYTTQKLRHIAKTVTRKRALKGQGEANEKIHEAGDAVQQRIEQQKIINREKARRAAEHPDPLVRVLHELNAEARRRRASSNSD